MSITCVRSFFLVWFTALIGLGVAAHERVYSQPIGEPMPARISYDGTISAAEITSRNQTTLELSLPPAPSVLPGGLPASQAFQVVGTSAYAYTVHAPGCRVFSEPNSGSIPYSTQGNRQSIRVGTDTLTLQTPNLPEFNRIVILRCKASDGPEVEQGAMPVGLSLAPLFEIAYELVDGYSASTDVVGYQTKAKLDLACPLQAPGPGELPDIQISPPPDQTWPLNIDHKKSAAEIGSLKTNPVAFDYGLTIFRAATAHVTIDWRGAPANSVVGPAFGAPRFLLSSVRLRCISPTNTLRGAASTQRPASTRKSITRPSWKSCIPTRSTCASDLRSNGTCQRRRNRPTRPRSIQEPITPILYSHSSPNP